MSCAFKAKRISENVWWVGAVDWNLRDFHGYSTDRGSSYNAYLVIDDKIALIDTVKKPFFSEMISRIESVIDPKKIDYIISNHSEMDHSGCLPETIELCRPQKVIASVMGVKALTEHFHLENAFTAVADGEELSLGKRKLTFVEARMVHWPDSMFSFLSGDGVLFSNDAFGMHLASGERFTDEVDESVIDHELKKYYANILLPLSGLIGKLLDKVAKLNLPVKIIATDHGPIWRKNLEKVLSMYAHWVKQEPANKAVIVYDTMWGSTEIMAKAIEEGLIEGGAKVVSIPLGANSRSAVATEILGAGALILGSPTINGNIFPTVADASVYLKGLKPKNLVGAVFSSYGWSGEAHRHLKDILAGMKIEEAHEGVNAKYVPDKEALLKCVEMGRAIAQKIAKNPKI